jgi:glycosidase
MSNDPLWYKDAIIYQIHVKSYCDSNRDGFGDFPGLIQKLDYIQSLGVTALWLLPFYPSPSARRRLRHRRLQGDQPAVRDPRRLRPLPRRGPPPQHQR